MFAVRKGHRYVTVVLNLDSECVISIGDGLEGEALSTVWKRLRQSGAMVRAFASNMWPAHIAVDQQALSDTIFVLDRFAAIELSSHKLTARRRLHRRMENSDRAVLMDIGWLFAKTT